MTKGSGNPVNIVREVTASHSIAARHWGYAQRPATGLPAQDAQATLASRHVLFGNSIAC